MIPLKDTIPSRTFPFVNVALIALNVIVFAHELTLGAQLPRYLDAFGLVPARLVFWTSQGGGALEAVRFLPLLTSMFFHGGFLHLIGNMLYLWIFGDNVEDRLGHFRYLAFYLLAGVAAGLSQVAFDPHSMLPTVGASGAIAGVLGAYLVSFPKSRIVTLVPIFFIPWIVEVPAVAYLIGWFVLQVLAALSETGRSLQGGVAWWAHAGGFLSGIALVWLLAPARASRRTVRASWS